MSTIDYGCGFVSKNSLFSNHSSAQVTAIVYPQLRSSTDIDIDVDFCHRNSSSLYCSTHPSLLWSLGLVWPTDILIAFFYRIEVCSMHSCLEKKSHFSPGFSTTAIVYPQLWSSTDEHNWLQMWIFVKEIVYFQITPVCSGCLVIK